MTTQAVDQAVEMNVLDFLNQNIEQVVDVYESGLENLKTAFVVPSTLEELEKTFKVFVNYFDVSTTVAPNSRVILDAAKRLPHYTSDTDFYI